MLESDSGDDPGENKEEQKFNSKSMLQKSSFKDIEISPIKIIPHSEVF